MKLVKYTDDYADEFDIYGFNIFTDEEYEKFIEIINLVESIEFCFGSNQSIEYETPEDLKSCFIIRKLTEQQYKEIGMCFSLPYGYFPQEQIVDSLSEEDYQKFYGDEE